MPSAATLSGPDIPRAGDPDQRISVLDFLRGFAVLGMILVNFNDEAAEGAGFGAALHGLIELLVSGKAYTTFAILFGVGFAIQLRRARTADRPFASGFLRRLAMLAVFGFIAEAGFGMNVLIGYAIWALPLFLVQDWTVRRLIVLAILCAVSRQIYELAIALNEWAVAGVDGAAAADAARRVPYQQRWDALQAAVTSTHYPTVVRARIDYMPWFYTRPWFLTPRNLMPFLFGMIALRAGLIESPRRHARLIASIAIGGAILWAAANWLLPLPWPEWPVRRAAAPLQGLLGLPDDSMLALTYIGAGLLIAAYAPAVMRRLSLVRAVGRMALTCYLIQVMAIDLFRSPYAFGLDMSAQMVPLATLALFGSLALFSVWWLSRFKFGPAEWLLRSATYGKFDRIRPP